MSAPTLEAYREQMGNSAPESNRPPAEYGQRRGMIYPAAQEDDHDPRLQKRAEIRRTQAKCIALRDQANAITREILRLNNEVDVAANEHQATCAPLQAELEEIGGKIADCITRHEPTPPNWEERRLQLIVAIESANTKLEQLAEDTRRLRERLEKRRSDLQLESLHYDVEHELRRAGCANPAWLDRREFVQGALERAQSEFRQAQKRLTAKHDMTTEWEQQKFPVDEYSRRRVRIAEMAVDAAGEECARLQAELQELDKKIIAE